MKIPGCWICDDRDRSADGVACAATVFSTNIPSFITPSRPDGWFDDLLDPILRKEHAKIKHCFCLMGFMEDTSDLIAGLTFLSYMGVDDIEADHVTLVLSNISPRIEVQVLKYRHPGSLADVAIGDLTKVGFNPICFAFDDLDAEVPMLTGQGVQFRNEVMAFHGRKLVFLCGPEGITVELAQWFHSRESFCTACSLGPPCSHRHLGDDQLRLKHDDVLSLR